MTKKIRTIPASRKRQVEGGQTVSPVSQIVGRKLKHGNPFKIETGYTFHKTDRQDLEYLMETIESLPVTKKDADAKDTVSIFVPKSVAPTKDHMTLLRLNAKRAFDKLKSGIVFKTHIEKDGKGRYIGARIWRIS